MLPGRGGCLQVFRKFHHDGSFGGRDRDRIKGVRKEQGFKAAI
jgi:hypothetical protein